MVSIALIKKVEKNKVKNTDENSDDLNFANLIYDFNANIDAEERYIRSKILVQRLICIGYFIKREELKRNTKFNHFWEILSWRLKNTGCKFYSRTLLFEAKRLYEIYKRFVNVIYDKVQIDNITIPLGLSKNHLLLIGAYCKSEIQQNLFIEKVIRHSLNISDLREQLVVSVDLKNPDTLLIVDSLHLKTNYDLRVLEIGSNWTENQIKCHIMANISTFIKFFFNDSSWGFFPCQNAYIGGKKKYLDLVFYNAIEHRYLIIELKMSCRASDIDRAKTQINSYGDSL